MDEAEGAARRKRREAGLVETHGRQIAVLDDMGDRAAGPLMWLGVRRQARSYLRHLATMQQSNWYVDFTDLLAAHETALGERAREADARLAAMDGEEVADAGSRLGRRVALFGKGGAGKTVVASTMARLLARRGRNVLAADMDRSPGLAYSIGMKAADVALPLEVLEHSDTAAYGWQLSGRLLPRHVVEGYAIVGPDGVRVTGFGKILTVDKESAKQTMAALIQLLFGFGEPDWDVIADLEAGPTCPFERYHAFSDDVVVVVGPAWRSAMTARRLLPMVGEGRRSMIVANRFRDEPDHEPDHAGLAPRFRIPYDPDVAQAEREGLCPLDECPDSPAIRAISDMVDQLIT